MSLSKSLDTHRMSEIDKEGKREEEMVKEQSTKLCQRQLVTLENLGICVISVCPSAHYFDWNVCFGKLNGGIKRTSMFVHRPLLTPADWNLTLQTKYIPKCPFLNSPCKAYTYHDAYSVLSDLNLQLMMKENTLQWKHQIPGRYYFHTQVTDFKIY